MFKKVLIANRGEIAVRIVRACRDMGIWSVALYDAIDRGSLHVRLADESVELTSELGYLDPEGIVQVALDIGAEAIHPGYGFLAERPDFIRACEQAGVAFIGPSSATMAILQDKIGAMNRVQAAGYPTPKHSAESFDEGELERMQAAAEKLGYPVVVKSCSGGRGRATRLIHTANELPDVVRQAHKEAETVFGSTRLFVEKAILRVRYVEVQLVADHQGNLVHLGERSGSLQRNNQKLISESPAPSITPQQREQVWQMALDIGQLFDLRNVGTVEFLLDEQGQFYFTEIKARIQVEHPVSEMIARVDLVREQIRLAAGKLLVPQQEDIKLTGWAMQCRINAEDPWRGFLPSPGHLRRFRLPGGPYVRVDTYAYSGCDVPVRYDPILAKLAVWGEDRDACVKRMRRALQDFTVRGIPTNLALHQHILDHPDFISGQYTTEFLRRPPLTPIGETDDLRHLAVAAAIAFAARNQALRPTIPDRLLTGWHRAGRQLSG